MTNNTQLNSSNARLGWNLFYFFCLSLVITNFGGEAIAAGSGTQEDVIGNTLCRVTDALTGGIAQAIATMAIFTVGVYLFMGKMQWGTAAATAAGVGIIFGAGKIVEWITGGESGTCATVTSVAS